MTAGVTPSDFSLLLPPGWVRLPLDGREHERVVALVNDKVQELPPQAREGLRRTMTRDVLASLEKARAAGGVDVFLSVAESQGLPIAASCLVTFLNTRDELPLQGLLEEFAADQVSLVTVAGARAVRRRYLEESESGDVVLQTTLVDYFVPLPASTGLLVLSFGTSLEPLAEALVQLFDAMAESLRWVT